MLYCVENRWTGFLRTTAVRESTSALKQSFVSEVATLTVSLHAPADDLCLPTKNIEPNNVLLILVV
jgi:hypothetical protein